MGYCTIGITYLMKVFSLLSLTRNLTVSTKRGYDNTHFLYSYVAMHSLCVLPHTIQVWGLVIVYSFQGFVRTSCQISGNQLRTFFFINNIYYFGVGWF